MGVLKIKTKWSTIFCYSFKIGLKDYRYFFKNWRIFWIFDDIGKKCQPLWKIFFHHHFVPLTCANMCAKFHDYRINTSEIRQGFAEPSQFWGAPKKPNRNETKYLRMDQVKLQLRKFKNRRNSILAQSLDISIQKRLCFEFE